MRLGDLCTLIRSKNAGPFKLTFDLMFDAPEKYEAVKRSRRISREAVAALYGCTPEDVQLFECDAITAIKFSIPRPVFQAEIGDGDMHGGQMFGPLVDIEIEESPALKLKGFPPGS